MKSWKVDFTLRSRLGIVEAPNVRSIESGSLAELLKLLSNQLPLGHGIETIGIKIELEKENE